MISQTQSNQEYSTVIEINPPDKVEKIVSSEIIVQGDFQASTNVYGRFGSQTCSPSVWTTPPLSSSNYEITFDCTNLIEQNNFKTGSASFSLETSKAALNLKGDVKLTYYNNFVFIEHDISILWKPGNL